MTDRPLVVDLHHHIVYGVDDGPQTMKDSQDMLLCAVDEGVYIVCATSHCMPGFEPYDYNKYIARLQEEADWCYQKNLPIRLLAGSEIMYSDSVPDLLRNGEIPTLNGTRYVLVEFFPGDTWERVEGGIRSVGNAGFNVVLAHCERYECLRTEDRLAFLKERYHIMAQMNCATVLEKKGLFGDRWVKNVLRDGTIDLVSSDSHGVHTRRCRMKECHAKLEKDLGKARADVMCGSLAAKILNIG